MPSKVRRPQAQKVRRDPRQTALMLELRRSGASGIHKGQGEYRRKPKHVGRGWDE